MCQILDRLRRLETGGDRLPGCHRHASRQGAATAKLAACGILIVAARYRCPASDGRKIEPARSAMVVAARGAPFTTAGFAKLVERAGTAAGFAFKAHPHVVRHACGFALANAGHDTRSLQAYLGHCWRR
jgi:integrase